MIEFKNVLRHEIVERKRLSENDILTILQDAKTVGLGQAIWESEAELEKYRKIINATIKWMGKNV